MRQKLSGQQPPIARRPVRRKREKPPAIGTLKNPYQRDDGIQTVKIAFRASVQCAAQLKAMSTTLSLEGIARNEWLEDLVFYGIETGFRPREPETSDDYESANAAAAAKVR